MVYIFLLQLILNFKRPLMKWGLLHIVATNICMWAITVVLEAAESYTHYVQETLPEINYRDMTTIKHFSTTPKPISKLAHLM